jgi:murein L,D-transpeptidase YcbB/YkuD
MKNLLIYTALSLSLFASCQNNTHTTKQQQASADDTDQNSTSKNISKRDYSINKSNSYSDLFLDSSIMENFIAQKKLPDTIARRIRSFYNARNYQFAWFTSQGLTEQAFAFWNLHDYVTTYDVDTSLRDRALKKTMDNLITEEKLSVNASNKTFINTELTLTQHFIKYVLHNYMKGYVKRKEMERFIPVKKQDIMYVADSILNKKHKDNKYFENVNAPYRLLKDQLSKYFEIQKKGGWPQIVTQKKVIKEGMVLPEIVTIKKRLQITGELSGNDTSRKYNDTLLNAVKTFQNELGVKPDGIITPALIKDMNVTAAQRIEQLLINMGRMRWMTTEPSGQLIVVNIPEFELHVYEGKRKAFDMDVVVGKEGHNTTIFSGNLNQIVFSPYWNVPPSIVKKEILPAIAKNPNYLEAHNMEQTGTEDGAPAIRQKPGPDNSLGRVKFLFPNSFNIYFHDTNAKSLFSKDKRAFSHGCIRLAEPEKMAEYLLRNNPEWTPDKIEEAMNRDQPQTVRLNKPVPVLITYYTAWVDDNGLLNFRDDIYSHDKDLSGKMFTTGL